ncbi:hypothetical protein Mapa_004286 [Marchantia paleacea]|nr:hypothetical protein Mapa_004286 [Marchantia paleacea]
MSFMQAEQQPSPWIKDLVHKLKWTYAALWTLNTTEGSRPLIGFDAAHTVAEWKDGWYNSDLNRSTRALSGNENVVRDDSRIEALFYSTYKSCSFQQGFGYVGLVLLKRESTWLTGIQEVLEHAFHTQALFLKTVMCTPWNNHVLELGKFEQEARNENVLHQIQRWLSSVTTPLNIQPSPGAVGSENDSGGSREAMQMSPSIASSMFADGSNCNVHFGPSSDILLKRNNNNQGSGGGGFSFSGHENASATTGAPGAGSRVQVQVQVRKKNSLGRYPPHSHDAISLLNGHSQDVLSQRRSITGQEKTLEMGSSFVEEWGPAAAGTSSIFQQVVRHDSDPIISCSGMGIPGISSLMPPDTFSQQHQQQQQQQQRSHPRGAASISMDQALLTSLPMTMATDISASLALPMDMLQDSSANLYGLHSKNSREWPTLEPSKEQSLVQMLEEFTDDDHLQRLQSPDHALIQTAVASSSDTIADWVGASTGTASISHQQQHHRHYDHHTQQRLQQQQRQQQQQQPQRVVQRQFEFPQNPVVSSLQNMTTPRPALANLISHQQHQNQHHPQQHRPQLVPHGGGQQPQLLPLGQQQQQQQQQKQVNQPGPPNWQQNISFTTPTAWVRWVSRKQASLLRYNGANPAALRINQMILKKLLTEMVPKIAKEQKAREQEAAQAVDTETSSHGHRVRMNSYPTTTSTKPSESGILIQDPQARTHMMAERRRRERENMHYKELRKLIPPTSRMDKATVLEETIKLVKKLRRRVRQLEKGNPDNSGTPNLSLVTSEDSQIDTTSPSSRREPGSPIPARTGAGSSEPELQEGKPPGGRFLDSCLAAGVPAPAPSQDENKEVVEVDRRACIQNELRAKIRTPHRPDTVIHILTCLKDLGLEVLSTNISIEKDWVHADFQMKMNEVHISRVSQFCDELQEALRKAIFPAESSNADSTLDGRSHSQDS